MISEIAGVVLVSGVGIMFLMVIYLAGVKQGYREMGRSVREYTMQKMDQGDNTFALRLLLSHLRERYNVRF